MRTVRNTRAGFTLIELLVVVAIIGVLAAIAIPQFSGRQGKAFDRWVMSDARNAAAGEEAYFTDNGAYWGGTCDTLPGFRGSQNVTCTADVVGNVFTISTSHPMATKSCTWSNGTSPNLICS